MVTQHPDHASTPYWHTSAYISTRFEAEEAYRSFADLGAGEYKWDWEGKLVDESVVERLFGEHFDYFSKNPLGEKTFLTFRLPNPRIETEFRLVRAFINIASAEAVSAHFGFDQPPLFEVILPLTETAEEMIALQDAYEEIHHLKHSLYKLPGKLKHFQVIPLFENITTIASSDEILRKYIQYYQEHFGERPDYLRPYVARSDPALNSGIIPTVLAIKIALSRYHKLSEKEHISLYPIIGAGSLPFRGGLSPDTVAAFAHEYTGIRTTTLQSGFRYDYPLANVITGITELQKMLPQAQADLLTRSHETALMHMAYDAEKFYKQSIEQIAPLINQIASAIPQRRERFQHTGLFGYSRGEGPVRLPRAIGFTCALYSLGIPPEFIGTGQAISTAKKTGTITLLEHSYKNVKADLLFAGKYLNKDNLRELAKSSTAWQYVQESVNMVEEYVGSTLAPQTADEKEHYKLTKKILAGVHKQEALSRLIEEAAVLRKSLG